MDAKKIDCVFFGFSEGVSSENNNRFFSQSQSTVYIALCRKILSFEPWKLSDLFYPRFACDPDSEETKVLKQHYRKEREKIVAYFEGKDLVEATLSLFCQE